MSNKFKVVLVFFLFLSVSVIGQTNKGMEVENLIKEIKQLENQLNSLYNSKANERDIRRVRLQLDERRDELEVILAERNSSSDGFAYIEAQMKKAIKDVGPIAWCEVFNNRLAGKIVKFRGKVLNAGDKFVEIGEPYLKTRRFGSEDIIYSADSDEIDIVITLYFNYSVKKYDISKLNAMVGNIVTIEGVMPDLLAKFSLYVREYKNDKITKYNNSSLGKFIDSFWLREWTLIE